jgi:hypothetical protein
MMSAMPLKEHFRKVVLEYSEVSIGKRRPEKVNPLKNLRNLNQFL